MEGFRHLFLMVRYGKIGTSAIQTRATAGVAGATTSSACRLARPPARTLGTDILGHSRYAIAPAFRRE